MTKYRVAVCIVLVAALCSFTFYQQQNNSPVVELALPAKGSTANRGGILSYQVNVTDKEDGTTKYEEIPQTEVFLKVKYLPSNKYMAAFLEREKQLAKTFITMKQNNCLNCHAVKQKLTGPSFEDIASKYGASVATYERLSKKIMKGSRGVWSDSQQMPAHPHLKKEAAVALAKLVVQYGSDKTFDLYKGIEGTITISNNKSSSVLVLIASYLDHGVELKNRKDGKGMTTIRLK